MSVRYVIHGGAGVRGTISVKGSPLATVGAMAASLLTTDKVTLTNVPHLYDLDVLIEELRRLGVAADWTHPHEMTIYASTIQPEPIIHASNLLGWSPALLGALIVRCQRVEMEVTELDLVDERLASTVSLLRQFGGIADWQSGRLTLSTHHLHGSEVELGGASPDHTLLAVLLASAAAGESILNGSVVDPETEDVFACIASMGGTIEQIDEQRLRVVGQPHLHGTTHQIVADRYEAALFAAMAILSGGDLLVGGVKPAVMMSFLAKLQQLGTHYQVSSEGIRFWAEKSDAFHPTSLSVRPYPGLSRDWLLLFLPLLCRADGESVVETDAADEMSSALRLLQGIGAEVHLNYNVARLFGPVKLVAARMEADGFAAALCGILSTIGANGTSELNGAEYVDARFESLPDRLKPLGVKIVRHED